MKLTSFVSFIFIVFFHFWNKLLNIALKIMDTLSEVRVVFLFKKFRSSQSFPRINVVSVCQTEFLCLHPSRKQLESALITRSSIVNLSLVSQNVSQFLADLLSSQCEVFNNKSDKSKMKNEKNINEIAQIIYSNTYKNKNLNLNLNYF